MKKKRLLLNFLLASILISVQACTNRPAQNEESEMVSTEMDTHDMSMEQERNVENAICVLHPTEGNNVSGVVTFTSTGSGVRVEAKLEGLTPGLHGFHVHEYGDCSAPDATTAGGHFNPEGEQHGGPDDQMRHVGDLGNIEAAEDGTAHLVLEDQLLSLNGAHSIIGRGLIVHAGEDDLTSQPTGDAGGRVACGVIGIDE